MYIFVYTLRVRVCVGVFELSLFSAALQLDPGWGMGAVPPNMQLGLSRAHPMPPASSVPTCALDFSDFCKSICSTIHIYI